MNEQELLIKARITELLELVKQSKHEIEEIRKTCHHTKSTIQMIDGGKQICKVCVVCDEIVGYPGPHELDDFLKE